MDVFLPKLPAHLTDQVLHTQLAGFTEALNIQDWSCQKPRRKPFGNITFLHLQDGERFLQRHERRSFLGMPRSEVPLVIFGAEVLCRRSNREPDPFLLKTMTKSAKDRSQAKK